MLRPPPPPPQSSFYAASLGWLLARGTVEERNRQARKAKRERERKKGQDEYEGERSEEEEEKKERERETTVVRMTTSMAAASRLARPPFVSFPRRRIDSLVIAFATAVARLNTQAKQSNLQELRRKRGAP